MSDRQRLEAAYIEDLRGRFERELDSSAPSWFSSDLRRMLVWIKINEARDVLDSLKDSDIENDEKMGLHAERAVADFQKAICRRPWERMR